MKLKAASLFITLTALFGQLPEDQMAKFDEAEQRIVWLPPTAFPQLPRNVIRALQRRGCTVPQGTFTKSRTTSSVANPPDPAKPIGRYCARSKARLRFWCSGMALRITPAHSRRWKTGIFFRESRSTRLGYSRGISAVGEDFIMRHYNAYGGPKPPPIDHQGIDDAFIEKALRDVVLSRRKVIEVDRGGLTMD